MRTSYSRTRGSGRGCPCLVMSEGNCPPETHIWVHPHPLPLRMRCMSSLSRKTEYTRNTDGGQKTTGRPKGRAGPPSSSRARVYFAAAASSHGQSQQNVFFRNSPDLIFNSFLYGLN